MRLKTVKITNFRGYRGTHTVAIDGALTGIVGRNDYGKSTILDALTIFFGAEGAKPEKADMNLFSLAGGADKFEIACEFDELPDELVLDDNARTTLAQEHLLNASGAFELVRVFKASTGKEEKTAIRCNSPTDGVLSGLLSQKMADLKKLGEERGVAGEVADKRVASLWRQAIRHAAAPYVMAETLVDVDKGLSSDSKSIWDKVQQQLPTFALFKSDRESSDGDAEAKNPLQQAVKEAQAELQERIRDIENEIEARVLEVAARTLEKLREMAPELAKELTPRFKEKPKWTFNFTLDGENAIPINKRGSGVRRLILLNFFRAEAERNAEGAQRHVIYGIEEPETSQHPNYQIMLMRALLALASQANRQIIVTTHVPALAGMIPVEGIRFVCKDERGVPTVKASTQDILSEVAESLGVLPETGLERARGVVLVEGKSDILFLHHTSNVLRDAGHIAQSLKEAGIVPIPTGGCGNLKHWVTQRLIDSLHLPWCVFMDSDLGGDAGQAKTYRKRREEVVAAGRAFYATRKREIENYLCPTMLFATTNVLLTFTDTDDAKNIIGTTLGMKPDDVIDKHWPNMTADMVNARSRYLDGGTERFELKDILEDILRLV